MFCKKETQYYCLNILIFFLNTRKNNVVIKKSTFKNLSLNVKIQTAYATKREFVPCMT